MPKFFDEFDLDLKKVEDVCLYSDDGTSNLTGGVTGGNSGDSCNPESSCCPSMLPCSYGSCWRCFTTDCL